MVSVKKGDVVFLEYVACSAKDKVVFATTIKGEAEKAGVKSRSGEYKPLLLVAGKGQVIRGLDDAIVGSEVGQKKHVLIPFADAFGARDAAKLKLISLGEFRKRDLDPYPGMVVELDDGLQGTVKSVEAGRVRVDFNEPLAGEDVEYDFTVVKCASDAAGKLSLMLTGWLGLDTLAYDGPSGVATVKVAASVRKDGDLVVNKISFVSMTLQHVEGLKKVVFEEEYSLEKEGA